MSTKNQPAPDEVRLASMAYIVWAHRTCCCPGRWEDLPKSVQEAWIDVVRDLRRENESPLRARIAELEAQFKQRQPMDATSEHVSPAVKVKEKKRPYPQVGEKVERKFSNGKWLLKEVGARWRGVFWVQHEGKDVGTLDVDEGRKWRWPASEEKPAETPAQSDVDAALASSPYDDGKQTVATPSQKSIDELRERILSRRGSDGKAKYEPSATEWAQLGNAADALANNPGFGAAAEMRELIESLIARAESAERARNAEEIAKLRGDLSVRTAEYNRAVADLRRVAEMAGGLAGKELAK